MNNLSDNVTKLNSINRRMFIIAAAKIIILGGIVSRLFFYKLKKIKNIWHFLIKIELENGSFLLLEESLKIILEILLQEILRPINYTLYLNKLRILDMLFIELRNY